MRTLGGQELEVLRFVADHEPLSVSDVASRYGEPNGLARTTILTMMERLRAKRYLTRVQANGVFVYRTAESTGTVLREVVGNFVENTLGGTVTPFIAFLSEKKSLEPDELDALKSLLAKMEKQDEA